MLLVLPAALLVQNDYGRTGPYGAVPVHGMAYHGTTFFVVLFGLGLTALLLGLLWPRLGLWLGPATRRRVLGLHGGVVLVAGVGLWESGELARAVYRYEDHVTASLFEELAAGMTLREAEQRGQARPYGKHLRAGDLAGSGDARLLDIHESDMGRYAGIAFPGIDRQTRLLVQIEPLPDRMASRMRKIHLIQAGRLVASK